MFLKQSNVCQLLIANRKQVLSLTCDFYNLFIYLNLQEKQETHHDSVFCSTFLTHGASGSRQTFCPFILRVALQDERHQFKPLWRFSYFRPIKTINKFALQTYMISMSMQWELAGFTFSVDMRRPMGLFSFLMHWHRRFNVGSTAELTEVFKC